MTNNPLKILMLNITERCNSRCIMCGVWKKKNPIEMDIEKIEKFFRENREDLREVETVGLVGGEPFLSKNHLGFIKLILKYCPNIKTIGQPTNGLLPGIYLKKAEKALKIISRGVLYGISVSIDGNGDSHDAIRGIRGGFNRSEKFIAMAGRAFARHDNFYLTLTTTVSKKNINGIKAINDLANKYKIRNSFRPAMEVESEYIDNTATKGWQLEGGDKKVLAKEFHRLFLENNNIYYDFMEGLLNGKKRTFPCPFQDEGFIINPDGKIFICLFSGKGYLGTIHETVKKIFNSKSYSKVRDNLKKYVCVQCSADCYSAKSTYFKKADYLEKQLDLILRGEEKKFIKNLLKNKFYIHDNLLKRIADFKEDRLRLSEKKLSDEEKIVYNTKFKQEKYKVNFNERNEIKLDYSEGNINNLILNLAKYYFIIKIYSKTAIYLGILKKYNKTIKGRDILILEKAVSLL